MLTPEPVISYKDSVLCSSWTLSESLARKGRLHIEEEFKVLKKYQENSKYLQSGECFVSVTY